MRVIGHTVVRPVCYIVHDFLTQSLQTKQIVNHIQARFLSSLVEDLHSLFRLKIKYRSTCSKEILKCTIVTANKPIQNLECSHHNKCYSLPSKN